MSWKTTLPEKIGDLLLGKTKEVIIRTDEAVKRIDKDFDEVKKDVKSIDRRVARIEGKFELGATAGHSPLRLTKIGQKILQNSSIKEAADKFKDQLLEKIREENPETAYDVQEVTRQVFQDFDFGEDVVKKLKEYAFQNGEWGLSDILDVGAIYFRDIALKELGFKVEDLNKKSKE
jgi:hypothetical protein